MVTNFYSFWIGQLLFIYLSEMILSLEKTFKSLLSFKKKYSCNDFLLNLSFSCSAGFREMFCIREILLRPLKVEPKYSLNRCLSHTVHHWSTILRFLPTILFLQQFWRKISERTKKASVDTVCTNREQFLEDVLHWIVDRVQVGVQRRFIENRKCKCPVKRRFWPYFTTT